MDEVTALTKGERTRQRLIDAATPHFATVGLNATSVPEIAREVGVSHSAVYQHFGNKDGLFRAALDHDLRGLTIDASESLDLDQPLPDLIAELMPRLLHAATDHPLAARELRDMSTTSLDMDQLPGLGDIRTQFVASFRDGQRAGMIRGDMAPEATVDGLLTITIGLLATALRRIDHADELPRARAALDTLSDLLRPERGPEATARLGQPPP